MSIPDYQSVMLPLLRYISDRQEHTFQGLIEALAVEFKLSDTERRELLPSGSQFIFSNRVGWARTYLKKAGLLSIPKRGVTQITDRGVQILKENPARVDNKVLRQFPEFLEFQSAKEESTTEAESTAAERLDPQENIEAGYQRIRKELSSELLTRIKTCSPAFFERLVVELLPKMGYGGSRRDFGEAIGNLAMVALMGLSKRTSLDSMPSIYKRSVGTIARLGAKKSKLLSVRYMEGKRIKGFSLQLAASPGPRAITCGRFRIR